MRPGNEVRMYFPLCVKLPSGPLQALSYFTLPQMLENGCDFHPGDEEAEAQHLLATYIHCHVDVATKHWS